MSKRNDFLIMIQTDFLIHFQNELAMKLNRTKKAFHVSVLEEYAGFMSDAIRASYRIPENMNCIEAAGEFAQFYLWRYTKEQKEMSAPSWFLDLNNEDL